MACDLETIQSEACTSGIGRVSDRISLLQIIAQLTCEASEGGGGSGVPSGVILMWSGTIASVPSGWAFCDGTNGTPDLRDRFVVAAQQDDAGQAKTNLTGALTVSGGSITHNHPLTGLKAQLETLIANEVDSFEGGDTNPAGAFGIVTAQSITETTDNVSAPQPYYALAFIMKT